MWAKQIGYCAHICRAVSRWLVVDVKADKVNGLCKDSASQRLPFQNSFVSCVPSNLGQSELRVKNEGRSKNPSTRRDNAVPRKSRYTANCGSSAHCCRETP